jgi:hypothetical protein
MSDRRELQAQKNKLAEMYQTQRVKMENAGASIDQLSRLKKMFNDRVSQLDAEQGDMLNKLNRGKDVRVSGGTSSGLELNQSKLPDMAKQVGLGKESLLKRLGKKALGVIPLAGAAYGLASGNPAMAAEEAAGDIPLLGQVYEAIKPEMAGDPEEEKMMLAEAKARKAYEKSPAFSDLRSRLQKKMGK